MPERSLEAGRGSGLLGQGRVDEPDRESAQQEFEHHLPNGLADGEGRTGATDRRTKEQGAVWTRGLPRLTTNPESEDSMTISEAVEVLTPLAKRLNCSAHIDPPSVWLHDHREYKPEFEPWKLYLSKPVKDFYCVHTTN